MIAALIALPALPFWAFGSTPLILAAGAFLMQVAVQGAWGVIPAHLNELSPAEIRATFPGVVYQLGNLLAAINLNLQVAIAEAHGNELRTGDGRRGRSVRGRDHLDGGVRSRATRNSMSGRKSAPSQGQGAHELVCRAVHCKFENERTRPVRDLLAACPCSDARNAVDIGCGPGNSTEVLAGRFPNAALTGLDSSGRYDLRRPASACRRCDSKLPISSAWTRGEMPPEKVRSTSYWPTRSCTGCPTMRHCSRRSLRGSRPAAALAVQMPDNLDEAAPPLDAGNGCERALARKAGCRRRRQRAAIASADWYFDCCIRAGAASISGGRRTTTRSPATMRSWSGSRAAARGLSSTRSTMRSARRTWRATPRR